MGYARKKGRDATVLGTVYMHIHSRALICSHLQSHQRYPHLKLLLPQHLLQDCVATSYPTARRKTFTTNVLMWKRSLQALSKKAYELWDKQQVSKRLGFCWLPGISGFPLSEQTAAYLKLRKSEAEMWLWLFIRVENTGAEELPARSHQGEGSSKAWFNIACSCKAAGSNPKLVANPVLWTSYTYIRKELL